MLTAEIKINGKLIGHLYIVNKGFVTFELGKINDECDYEYECYMVEEEEPVIKGHVKHSRKSGALELIKKVIRNVQKNKKRK